MLFQPSNIYPSTFSGIGAGTVDVTQGLNVSWQVNGDTPMTAYQIKIYQNDSGSTLMYDSGSVTVSPAFEPHDKYGNATYFTAIISAAALSTAGIINGYQYGYKMLITQWWGISDYVEQTSASVFITRSTPNISIDAIPNPVAASSITITATYSQAQGDPISTVEWVFALAGSESNPIRKTGAISTQVLSFDADGLITGNTYSIMCNVVTSTGMEASTGFVQFPVLYSSSSLGINYQLAQLKNSSAVYLSWDYLGSNILAYPYTDTTKTTNGITFTVNGEGDVVASGTASADAYFTIAEGTSSQLGMTAGKKFVITSGYSGSKIVITETNGSNVVVATIEGSDPLQYIATSTTNTLKFSIVIPSGSVLSSGQQLKPMIALEDKIVAYNDVSVNIEPTQDLHGYANPWPAGGGKNKFYYPTNFNTTGSYGLVYKYDKDTETFSITGTNTHTSAYIALFLKASDGIATPSLTAGQTCYIYHNLPTGTYLNLTYFDGNGVNKGFSIIGGAAGTGDYVQRSFIVPNDYASYSQVQIGVYGSATQINKTDIHIALGTDSAFTEWTPYSNICPISGLTGLNVYVSPTQDPDDATVYNVDWTTQAGTVYGGTLDVVTGVLVVDRGRANVLSSWSWNKSGSYPGGFYVYINNTVTGQKKDTPFMCSHAKTATSISQYVQGSCFCDGSINIRIMDGSDTVQDWKDYINAQSAAGTPIQICYELATPITYQLTPMQVAALVTNNVWTNAGDVTVSYTTDTGAQATLTGPIVSFSNTNAQNIPTPQYIPGITGLSIYRYLQGELALQHVYDLATVATSILDYFAPSQTKVSYLLVAHSNVGDLFLQTTEFTPIFWFYSVLLCDTDSNGNYHVSREYIFKYGVETGAVSNNNDPTIQRNFTPYPNRQPISTLYKTGKVSGYIGKTNNLNQYSDTISLQNAIYDISVSPLEKFLKTRKGDVIKVDTASSIQMKTEDNSTQQALKATLDWVEVGDSEGASIVSVSTDQFWPMV